MRKLWVCRKAAVLAASCGVLLQGTIVCDIPAVDVIIDGTRHYDDDYCCDDDDCCDDSFFFEFWESEWW
ncbi:MAG: hypothetical protein ACKVS9_04150 [Phycisphaerae bacterium]